MRHPTRSAVLGAVAAVAMAACSGSDAASTSIPSTSETTTSTSTTSTTTTTTTTSSTTTSTTEPATTTTSDVATTDAATTTAETPTEVALDDFEYIIEEFSRRVVAMYAEPNLEAVAGICAPQSPCEAQYTAQIREQIDLGEHTEGGAADDVTEFEIVGFDKETLQDSSGVVVNYVAAPLGDDVGRIVDADGNVVIELAVEDPDKPGRGQITLVRSSDTALPWRIVNQTSLGPVE